MPMYMMSGPVEDLVQQTNSAFCRNSRDICLGNFSVEKPRFSVMCVSLMNLDVVGLSQGMLHHLREVGGRWVVRWISLKRGTIIRIELNN